ncbi:hypothetical protein ABOONEI_2456 [Aciduliprofundum boonei T469]|nr:hypothetical protein ABOONEI_2456 [Aciduliprofundum boonei T469]
MYEELINLYETKRFWSIGKVGFMEKRRLYSYQPEEALK